LKLVETLNDSKVRKEMASAKLAETELELKTLELETARGSLVTAIDAKRLVEDVHLAWLGRLDKLADIFAEKMADAEVGQNVRDSVRELLEQTITEIREKVAEGDK
jgi:hypothetical protein